MRRLSVVVSLCFISFFAWMSIAQTANQAPAGQNSATARAAAKYPIPSESDYTIKDFKFASGETLPTLRLHYRTLGTPQRSADGSISNAVLLLHSTSGSSEQFLNDRFASQAFN